MSSRNFLGPVWAILGMACVFLTLAPQVLADQDSHFRVYAELLFEKYDSNEDGFLDQGEISEMKRPPSDVRFDSNSDGKISLDELVKAIARPSSPAVKEKTPDHNPQEEQRRMSLKELADLLGDRSSENEQVKSPVPDNEKRSNWNLDDLNLHFLEASLRKNDKNGNGQLDPDEIAAAVWSAPRWQESDTNRDGILTRDEMHRRYEKMFAERLAQSSTNQKETDKQQEAARRALMQQMQRSGRASSASSRATLRSPRLPAKPAAPATVDMQLYLLRLPEKTSSSAMTNAIHALKKKAAEPTVEKVANVANRLGIKRYDQMTFAALDGKPTRVSTGASIPVAVNQTASARGRTAQVVHHEVGLMVEANSRIQADHIALELEISKSDVIQKETDDEDLPDSVSVVQWKFNSSVRLEKDELSITGASAGDQHWILVLKANRR